MATALREAVDGFKSPNENYSIYLKTVKQFAAGSVAFGGYFARSSGYRVPVIPTTPQAGVTITGNPGEPGSTLYSQQTSGFFSALPFSTYEKLDSDALWVIFIRAFKAIDRLSEAVAITSPTGNDRRPAVI